MKQSFGKTLTIEWEIGNIARILIKDTKKIIFKD